MKKLVTILAYSIALLGFSINGLYEGEYIYLKSGCKSDLPWYRRYHINIDSPATLAVLKASTSEDPYDLQIYYCKYFTPEK